MADFRDVMEYESDVKKMIDAAQDENTPEFDRSVFASLAVAKAVLAVSVRLDYLMFESLRRQRGPSL